MALTRKFGVTDATHTLELGKNESNTIADLLTAPSDGWVIQINAMAAATDASELAQFAIWQGAGNNPVLYRSGAQQWGTNNDWRHASVPNLRIDEGRAYWFGYFIQPGTGGRRVSYVGASDESFQGKISNYLNAAPDNFDNFTTLSSGRLSINVDYVPNDAPNTPVWRGETPSGLSPETDPVFSATMPHPASEGGRDHTSTVQVQIYDDTDGETVYNRTFSPTNKEENQGYFERQLYTHTPGHDYRVRCRHQDSFGVWSSWTAWRSYTLNEGPNRPTNLTPDSKIDTNTPAFSGDYSHPQNVASAYVQIQVWNAEHTTLIADSGFDSMSGSSFTHGWNYFDGADSLLWGEQYTWRSRFKDANGAIGPWSAWISFSTDAAPYEPSNLSPTGGEQTKKTTLSFQVRDPDGDDIVRAYINLDDVTNGQTILSGYTLDGPWPSGTTVEFDASSYLTLGTEYAWSVSVTDGTLNSPRTPDQHFIYADVPEVTLLAPSGPLTNLVAQPSAEYDPADVGQYWTPIATNVGNTYTRLPSPDTPRGGGGYVWQLDSDGSRRPELWSPAIPVTDAKKYFLTLSAKKLSGTSALRLFVSCRDASGNTIGYRTPAGPYPALPDGGADVADTWTRYGGLLTVPSGTAKVVVIVSNAQSATTLLLDEFYLVELPGDMPADGGYFYGYFDGDTTGYGDTGADDYYWSDVAGNSESIGLARLTVPATKTNVEISYSASAAKASDRLRIERWVGGAWQSIHDETTSSSRTTIPLPAQTIRNEGRYRLQVTATDVNGLSGSTGWVEFDVRYDGPSELVVTQITDDPIAGSIGITWEPSTLSAEEFAGIEVQVSSREEGEIIADRIMDPAATSFTYHYPVSGRSYDISVRQLAIEDTEEVGGPWRGGPAVVNYDRWIVKSVESPDLYISFVPFAEDEPQRTRKTNRTAFRPHGRSAPTFLVGEERDSEGTLTVRFLESDELVGDSIAALDALYEQAGTVCILTPRPPEKIFAQLGDISESAQPKPYYVSYEIPYEEAYYAEDYYVRTGETP